MSGINYCFERLIFILFNLKPRGQDVLSAVWQGRFLNEYLDAGCLRL